MLDNSKPDSLIFDMDGTLWDNVDTYANVWTLAFSRTGYNRVIKREDILNLMGRDVYVMLQTLLPDAPQDEHERVFRAVGEAYDTLVHDMTPRIYDGVMNGLEKLSKHYKLFLLSNCEKNGLVKFMNHTRSRHLFVDYMEHGMNHCPKHKNMQLLVERYQLQRPLYIGDTASDNYESDLAGIPFVWVTYGFGTATNYISKFDSFDELTSHYLTL